MPINVNGDGPSIRVSGEAPAITVSVTTGDGGGGGGGGQGNASHWLVDWIGAFGPGFDALYATSSGPFVDPSLQWGPDYLLIQTPWNTYETYQATDGQTIACASYLDESFASVTANERLWTLTGGEWVMDATQPTEGDLIAPLDPAAFNGDWMVGLLFMLTGEGRIELVNLQHERASVAQMTGVRTVTEDGSDNPEAGAPWGTILVDATAGPVTRTLPTEELPGRVIQYVKISDDTNPVIIEGEPGVPLLTPDNRVVLYLPGESARFTSSGTYWYPMDGRYGSTTQRVQSPHGIEDRSQSTLSFDDTTREFTISPVDDRFVVWCSGIDYTIDAPQTVTLPDFTDLYLIYFEDGVLDWSTAFPNWPIQATVAYVYWNTDTNQGEFIADERHGITMDWATHEYLHRTRGAALASGFDLSNYTTTGDGSSAAHAQVQLAGGTFFDEDMEINVVDDPTPTAGTFEQVLSPAAQIPVFYRSAEGWTHDTATSYPLKQGTARARYNFDTGTGWTTVDAGNNKYVSSWVCATNMLDKPVVVILGQSEHSNADGATAVAWTDLDLTDLPLFEIRPLWHLVFQTSGSYANTPHARLRAVVDTRVIDTSRPITSVNDHGGLAGLGDDDHTQYALADGTRGAFAPSTHASTHASAGSDPVSLATSQITSGVLASSRLALPIGMTGAQLSGGATGGHPLLSTNSTSATQAAGVGTLFLGQTQRSGTLNYLGFNVTTTALSAGQQVYVVAYNASATTGLPTTLAWSQLVTVGTSTGVLAATSLSLTLPAGAWVGVHNLSTNAGSVTFTAASPVVGPVILGSLVRFGLSASSQGASPAADLSAYTYSTASGATVLAPAPTVPQIIARLT